MRLVIDLQGAQSASRVRGIGRYSLSLTDAIAQLCMEQGHELWLLFNALLPQPDNLTPAIQAILNKGNVLNLSLVGPTAFLNPNNHWRLRASELVREYAIGLLRPDCLLITSLFEGFIDDSIISIGLLKSDVPTAVILYDLIPFLNQATYLQDELIYNWYMRKIEFLKRANLILAISDYTKLEAITALNISKEQITSISSAVDERFRILDLTASQKQELLAKYHISKPFLLFVGTDEPRKNIDTLIRAYGMLPLNLQKNFCLVIICQASKSTLLKYHNLAASLGIDPNHIIIPTERLPDTHLIALYNLCTLFVYPSLHEGFGLPVLEAMSCGAPVIGANTTSIPEVIDKDTALFDPTDPASISERIAFFLSNPEQLNALKTHGIQRAKHFSWTRSAQTALNAILELLNNDKKEQPQSSHLYHDLLNAIKDIPAPQPSEGDLNAVAASIAQNEYNIFKITHIPPRKLSWRIEGPFDSSYSLAIINRELAFGLETLGHDISLYSTEGPGDFEPDTTFLSNHPEIAKKYLKGKGIPFQKLDVVSRLLYPPRVHDMQAGLNMLHCYAWEETGFPYQWVKDFNLHLNGITCLSSHVKKVLQDSGVTVPIFVVGCGVDHWERITPASEHDIMPYLQNAKPFRFLHVSSCFPRKGADILLKAYFMAFNVNDPVTLIIKTFQNPHNKIHDWLKSAISGLKDPALAPDVIIIEQDLTDAQLKAICEKCHCLVAPSRAEGFALPIAEAMLSGIPVITTAWGGQMDFCNEDTAWLVDFEFEYAKTHMGIFSSLWAEPNAEHLAQRMKEVFSASRQEILQKTLNAQKFIRSRFTWKNTAEACQNAVMELAYSPPKKIKKIKIAWISTYNTRCGIAEYSAHLLSAMDPSQVQPFILAPKTDHTLSPDPQNLIRCWKENSQNLHELYQTIKKITPDLVMIQFNYGFFDFSSLSDLIHLLATVPIPIFITLHSTTDPADGSKTLAQLADALKMCERIFVHTPKDANRLKQMKIINNVTLLPHFVYPDEGQANPFPSSDQVFLASYGFFLPPKGLLELIQAVKLQIEKNNNVHLLLLNAQYPLDISANLIKQAQKLIKDLKLQDAVTLQTDFLPNQQALSLLKKADLILFPYQYSSESASGAVRMGIATKKPVAVTPLEVFDDVKDITFRINGFGPEDISQSIETILTKLRQKDSTAMEILERQKKFCEEHSIKNILSRLQGIIINIITEQSIAYARTSFDTAPLSKIEGSIS